jgi:pyridoxine kinase
MNILSIQSWVAYGHVGNASAMFPLQRLGAEVWAVNTVQFSNHTGYGAWRGQVFGAELVRDCVTGIASAACSHLRRRAVRLHGRRRDRRGDPGRGGEVKAANPAALWCCDPVIGDVGRGVFVRPGIPEFLRDRAMPRADIATPQPLRAGMADRHAVADAGRGEARVAACRRWARVACC